MLLYIHVPFCRAKCRYCAFHSVPVAAAGVLREYTDTLLAEIALWGDRLGNRSVESVFFGGGTPSLLPPKDVTAILNRIRKVFSLSPATEINFEANPESFLTTGYAHEIAAAGVNRLSLGVQSLTEERLAFLGRLHGVREATAAYEAARAANFTSISLDLMWGLPGQRQRDWMRELATACAMQPEHISCYGLTLEEGTPMAKAFDEGGIALPSERELGAMYLKGSDYLESQGYLQYEVSSYARMGSQCRHNLGYWEGHDYIGFGPAATSTFQSLRWTNPCGLIEWAANVRRGATGCNTEALTPKIRLMEMVMLRLRTTRGLHLKTYRAMTGREIVKDNKKLIHMLHRRGLIRIQEGYLGLTRKGLLVSNTILEHFFSAIDAHISDKSMPDGEFDAKAPSSRANIRE